LIKVILKWQKTQSKIVKLKDNRIIANSLSGKTILAIRSQRFAEEIKNLSKTVT
jgi:hypothetical protein